MRTRHLVKLWPVSALALGGGGIGQLWGETTRDECIATVHAAIDAGIDLLDLAPSYGMGEAENVIGAAFEGKLPDGIKVTTKCRLGTTDPDEIEKALTDSLSASLERMRLERVDIFFLHSNIVPDDYDISVYGDRPATRRRIYHNHVQSAFETLVAQGRIGAWGITGIGIPSQIIEALESEPKPAVVQSLANPVDSAGELNFYGAPTQAREVIATATEQEIGVMGIRAAQGGAFTDTLDRDLPEDHGVRTDFNKAGKFRALAAERRESAAALAHRYALSMAGVEMVVLGVKNRTELEDCLQAEAAGPLSTDEMAQVEASFA